MSIQSQVQEQISQIRAKILRVDTRKISGRLLSVTGPLVRADLPAAKVGEVCEMRNPETGEIRLGEVVGVDGNIVMLAPHGSTEGLSIRTEVIGLGRGPSIMVGDHLLGSVVDAFGKPMTGIFADFSTTIDPQATMRPVVATVPEALSRPSIDNPLSTGIRAIDGFLTCGEGQRVGIFGSAGAGKSTLISEIVTQSDADIVVVGLVGERGREVGDFVNRTLKHNRNRAVLVVATSDRPPLERMQASLVATTIAEYFRDQGKRVLLVIDSVTRLARALRDIGLAAGEPPTRRGFTPSVFATLPLIFERAGRGAIGSITAFYTVLVEGDPMADPVVEETRSLLDGHIVLSEKLASEGHYPAIDVLESKSRLMSHIVTDRHQKMALHVRELMARYRDVELLIQVGEYRAGVDALTDEAVRKIAAIKSFLRQRTGEMTGFDKMLTELEKLYN